MKYKLTWATMIPIYLIVFIVCLSITVTGSKIVTIFSENTQLQDRTCIIIDAGHGGVDGGATSCTGILESQFNLEIAIRLNDLLRLLGYPTQMIRETDISVYTEGQTIAAKKVSDLKNRVSTVNQTRNGLLISIHQNYFIQDQYSGAQVFYSNNEESKLLATELQKQLVHNINKGSNRKAKKADGIYLMEHIKTTGVLLECGFLSNPSEESKLKDATYQKHLCCVISSVLSNFLDRRNVG